MKRSTKVLLSLMILGPVIFTAAWIVLGFVSTGYTMWDITVKEYSPISQQISGLGLGNTAPYMNSAFILSGLFIILGSIGFAKALTGKSKQIAGRSAVLLSLVGFGAAIDGIFTFIHFLPHMMGFLLALSPIVTFPYLGYRLRKDKSWRAVGNVMITGSPILLVLAIMYFATFKPEDAGMNIGIAGLTERILVTTLMGWYATIGMLALGSKDWNKK